MSATVNFIGARIDSAEVYNNKMYTVVSTPAPDQFSHPSKYRVTSDKAIGVTGALVDIDCTMRGMVRSKNYKDTNTGQQKTYIETDVYFDVYAVRLHAPQQQQSLTQIPENIKKP
jgi:hypothetical protein